MLTPKQQKSMDFVAEVFQFFFDKAYHANSMVHTAEALHVAGKLTQVYFDNHYSDGTPCDSEEVSE